ncbi:pyridine nucleotide transhydrogenase [Achromobacter kerstersii]
MTTCLIGFSGFVGTTLLRQAKFEKLYHSQNIADIQGQAFDVVVCAGAPAQKWVANRDPETDSRNIQGLIEHLRTITCKTFILVSTVDVFKSPQGVDESTTVDETGLHAYGLHRRQLEKFVEQHFPNSLIVRLPGLVGPGLRKNVLFDLLNCHNLSTIESRGIYQFYPMVCLWQDIQTSLRARLRLVHLTAEPISVADVATQGFGKSFTQTLEPPPPCYDIHTRHAEKFGTCGPYLYSAREEFLAIRAYAQSETRSIKAQQGNGT